MSYSTLNDKHSAANDDADDDADVVKAANSGEDEYTMPCAEAILAGTLALMTGHARCGCATHRDMMASKAACNLASLAKHPVMSEEFRVVAAKLHTQWVELIHAERISQHQSLQTAQHAATVTPTAYMSSAEMSRAEMARALWHKSPEVIQ